jgi:hypothetical protein
VRGERELVRLACIRSSPCYLHKNDDAILRREVVHLVREREDVGSTNRTQPFPVHNAPGAWQASRPGAHARQPRDQSHNAVLIDFKPPTPAHGTPEHWETEQKQNFPTPFSLTRMYSGASSPRPNGSVQSTGTMVCGVLSVAVCRVPRHWEGTRHDTTSAVL